MNGKQIAKFCGMVYIKNAQLTESPAHVKATFINMPTDRKHDVVSTRLENEFTFEIEERFKKTEFDKANALDWSVEVFHPYILYDFRITRFGKNISK